MHEIDHADMHRARAYAERIAPADSDIESAAMEGLLNAAETFDGRGSWTGYSNQRIRWAVLDELRRSHPAPVDVSLLPDTTPTYGPVCLDDRTADLCAVLIVELAAMRAEYLLDGVDRRRLAHRGALAHLNRVLR